MEFRLLSYLTGVVSLEVRTSSSYLPQTDGLTERTNQTIEQFLLCMLVTCDQEWSDILWALEFAYNNVDHPYIDMSPFFCAYGFHPKNIPGQLSSSLTRLQ